MPVPGRAVIVIVDAGFAELVIVKGDRGRRLRRGRDRERSIGTHPEKSFRRASAHWANARPEKAAAPFETWWQPAHVRV